MWPRASACPGRRLRSGVHARVSMRLRVSNTPHWSLNLVVSSLPKPQLGSRVNLVVDTRLNPFRPDFNGAYVALGQRGPAVPGRSGGQGGGRGRCVCSALRRACRVLPAQLPFW